MRVNLFINYYEKRELNKFAAIIKPYELDLTWVRSNKKLLENNMLTPDFIKPGDSNNIHIILFQFYQYLTFSKKDIHNAVLLDELVDRMG